MEGAGARLSRSSTRYGPATVFTGPVRKWKKKWVHVSSNASSNHHHSQTTNGTTTTTTNGNNGSHLLLYKWTPITQSQNTSTNGDKSSPKNDVVDNDSASNATEEPPRRRFKYIPIAVLEEQKKEDAGNVDDEAKPSDTEPNTMEPTSKSDGSDEKPDINDVPMEERQVPNDNPLARQDLNESTLDLSLGLAHDVDLKTEQTKDG